LKSLHSTEYNIFLEHIVAARKESGVTQQQLAERLGKPQSYVSKYERGERRIDVVEFLRIAKMLNADPCCILKNISHAAFNHKF
jgi:transcriptional regulator with XRE-family HTH domain